MDIQPGIHWPHCIDRKHCIGCMPALDLPPIPARKPPLPDLSGYFKPGSPRVSESPRTQ